MTTQFKTPTADLQHQYDLLQKEFEYEKEMYRQQIERTGIHRRIQQGPTLCKSLHNIGYVSEYIM